MEVERVLEVVADDGLAAAFQSLGQYRAMLIKLVTDLKAEGEDDGGCESGFFWRVG